MPEDIMLRARRSMSDRERDVTRFLSELHRRIEETQSLEADAARASWRNSSSARRRSRANGRSAKPPSSRNWSAAPIRRWPSSKSRRRRRIGKIAQGADQRKAEQDAQRRVAKTKRELREDFETTVLATQDDSRQDRIQPAAHRRRRARAPARMCASRRACAAMLGNGRIEVEAGFMKMQVSIDDVIEVLPESAPATSKLPQERQLQARAGAGARCTRRST